MLKANERLLHVSLLNIDDEPGSIKDRPDNNGLSKVCIGFTSSCK